MVFPIRLQWCLCCYNRGLCGRGNIDSCLVYIGLYQNIVFPSSDIHSVPLFEVVLGVPHKLLVSYSYPFMGTLLVGVVYGCPSDPLLLPPQLRV